jgi:hypothetical protein
MANSNATALKSPSARSIQEGRPDGKMKWVVTEGAVLRKQRDKCFI